MNSDTLHAKASIGEGNKDEKPYYLDEHHNPFEVPNDEEIFLVRDREKEQQRNARREFNKKKVWEKNTNKPVSSVRRHIRQSKESTKHAGLADKAHLLGERRREKENTADFIAKKREMFLVQMSLDTKKEEIRKLEEKAKMKEEALRKSELMLEADAIRFDKFLKENDRNAHEAIKRHDEESKAKQERVAQIKKLNHECAKVQSEMAKYTEQLEDCLKYKHFLDQLTPQHLKLSAEERAEQKRLQKEEKAAAAAAAGSSEESGTKGEAEEEEADNDDDVEPIYFTEPEQLLEIFSALEERNLFLIQNSQETEEALEELKKKYEETKEIMQKKTETLSANIEELQQKIQAEHDKAKRLEQRVASNVGVGKQEQMLQQLGQKVTEVYSRCGFNPDANPDTLDKLAEIERKLEQLITSMSLLPPEYVRTAEKKKESERRDRVRKQKVLEKQRAYEERLAKSVARATAAIPQRTGKKIMFRSPPLKRRQKSKRKDDQNNTEDEQKYQKFFI